MAADHFCLRWNNYQSNMVSELDILRSEEYLVDVTLCCEGHKFRAHKVILSACSPYFRNVFKENPCEHPVVILKDVMREDVEALLSFIYQGVVYVSEKKLSSFLQTAELLQIKGLAGAAQSFSDESSSSCGGKSTSQLQEGIGSGGSGGGSSSPVKRRKGAPVRLVKTEDGSNSGIVGNEELSQNVMDTDLDNDLLIQASSNPDLKAEGYDSLTEMKQDDDSLLEDETGSENGCDGIVPIDEKGGGWAGGRPPPPLIDTSSQMGTVTSAIGGQSAATGTIANQSIGGVHNSGGFSSGSNNQGSNDVVSPSADRNGRRPCPLCTKVISNKSNLLKHMRIRHSDVYNPACCVLCNKIFKNKYSLRAHLNIYHKDYISPGVAGSGGGNNTNGNGNGIQVQLPHHQVQQQTPPPPPPLIQMQTSFAQQTSFGGNQPQPVPVSEML